MVLSFGTFFFQRYHAKTTKDCANLRSNKDLRGIQQKLSLFDPIFLELFSVYLNTKIFKEKLMKILSDEKHHIISDLSCFVYLDFSHRKWLHIDKTQESLDFTAAMKA